MDLSGAVAPQPHMMALPHLSNMASMGFQPTSEDSEHLDPGSNMGGGDLSKMMKVGGSSQLASAPFNGGSSHLEPAPYAGGKSKKRRNSKKSKNSKKSNKSKKNRKSKK